MNDLTEILDKSYIDYDLIIGGGGAAGLSLAYRLAEDSFSHLKILLIEPESKTGNDHTWCSWTIGDQIFDECAANFYSNILFKSNYTHNHFDISPYRYRMISSANFYAFVDSKLNEVKHITRIVGKVNEYKEDANGVVIKVKDQPEYYCKNFFKCFLEEVPSKENILYVDQHFKGWWIETEEETFDPSTCTFMDFTIDQENEVRFMYVLPISAQQALVEVAIFSNKILEQSTYDLIISEYICNDMKIEKYKISEEEFGIIPMTDFNFMKENTKRVVALGSAGGAIKPSTGYAFMKIQEQCDHVIACLKTGKEIDLKKTKSYRHLLYDKTLLSVILEGKIHGDKVFSDLFIKNKPQDLFKFLDEKTNLMEELRLMSTCNLKEFGSAFVKSLF